MAKQIYNVGGVKVRAETPEIASSLAGEIAGTKASVVPSTSSNPVAPTSPAIPADVLTAPTPTPIKVTAPSPATEGAALDSTLGATAKRNIEQDAFTAQQAQETAKAEAPYKASLSEMMKGILGTKGATELTSEAYNTGGVDVAKKTLTDISQKILADQEAERVRIMDLRKNAGGLEASGLAQIEQEIQDKGIQRRAALAVTQLAAQGEYYGAKEVADRAVAASVERQKNRNDALQFIYQENKEQFTKAEQRQFETAQADRNRKLEMEEYKQKSYFDEIIKQRDPLYQAQLAKARAETEATGVLDINKVIDPTKDAVTNNVAGITALIGSSKVGQGTKTQIANILGVINASKDLAEQRTGGEFKGLSPIRALTDIKIPFTEIGIPGTKLLKRQATIENEGYLDAINLKVQQWASGASLTKQQIDQVNKFTPSKNDTDKAIRTKLNNLTNFMLTQTQSQLQSEGIGYIPAKVNLFETYDLLQKATPEQKAELKAAGLIN